MKGVNVCPITQKNFKAAITRVMSDMNQGNLFQACTQLRYRIETVIESEVDYIE